MDNWDRPEFWRMIEWVDRAQKQQRQIDEAARVSRLVSQIGSADRLREWDRFLSVQQAIDEVHQLQQSVLEDTAAKRARQLDWLLRSSAKPFPDISAISLSPLWQGFFDAYNNLNSRLADAALLGEVELKNEEAEEERDAIEVESQLIEIVPAEALESLRRVGFVPFSLLSRVVARPDTLFELTPRTFEEFVAELVSRLGIDDVVLTPERGDGGRDVIGTKTILGFPLIFAFECKRYAPDNPVPIETARALLGTISHSEYRADRGVLVTTSRFTAPARHFILTSPQLEGRDFNGIVDWLREFAKLQQGRTGSH